MPQELLNYLSDGLGLVTDPQTVAESELEWLQLGSPTTTAELIDALTGVTR